MRIEARDAAAVLLACELATRRGSTRPCPVVSIEGAELYATNGDVALRYRLEGGEVASPLRLAAGQLAGIVKASKALTLEASDAGATLEAEGARYTLPIVAEHPPQLERVAELATGFASVPVSVLSSLERRVSYAASRERSRYSMDGVRLELSREGLRAVATDGKRLAVAEHSMMVPDLAYGVGVVPVVTIPLACKLAAALEHHALDVRITDRVLSLSAPGLELTARLVEGQFPPFEAVIPPEAEHAAIIQRDALSAALARVSVVLTREMRTVRWRFCGRCLTLSAQAADVGSSSVAVDIDYNGPTLEIGVSPEFMREGLKALEGDDIALELRTPSEAVSIRADDLLYVVMPVNLG